MKQSFYLKEPSWGETNFGCSFDNQLSGGWEKEVGGGKGGLQIDFEKAYDHVLEKKGFSIKWRSWVRGCLSSMSCVVLVNGNAKGWVKAIRGLR